MTRAEGPARGPGRTPPSAPRLVVATCLLAVVLAACSGTEPLSGTVLTSSEPAPPFELRDQFGRSVALGDYRGLVVVLTFLYTYCPDICPALTSRLQKTHQMLGDDADQVAFVAVSVDPGRDTVERAYTYSQDWDMLHKWAFLTGDEQQLSTIWASYYIDPSIDQAKEGRADAAHTDASQQGAVDARAQAVAARYEVNHSAPVYVIDRRGLMRVLFTPPLDTDGLVHDIRALLD